LELGAEPVELRAAALSQGRHLEVVERDIEQGRAGPADVRDTRLEPLHLVGDRSLQELAALVLCPRQLGEAHRAIEELAMRVDAGGLEARAGGGEPLLLVIETGQLRERGGGGLEPGRQLLGLDQELERLDERGGHGVTPYHAAAAASRCRLGDARERRPRYA